MMFGMLSSIRAVRPALALCLALVGAAPSQDLSELDLSGDWYVLVHYKDDRSQDKSITKFKDFAWSIEQGERKIRWQAFPYVMFGEELEIIRRHAMMEHLPWEPSDSIWKRIRDEIKVSSRAATQKTLRGALDSGFSSAAPSGRAGLGTLTFSRDWTLTFAPDRVTITVTDSLSGSSGLEGMKEATVYEILERVGADELRGSFEEATRHGSFRMVRARGRRMAK